MTPGLGVSNLADDWLDNPIGTTTPAMREAARRCIRRHQFLDQGAVLEALGLAPYDQQPPPNNSYDGHQASVRNRVRKPHSITARRG